MPKRSMCLLHKDILKTNQYAFTASTSENVWASLALYSLQPSFTDEADETWGYHHKRNHHHHHQRNIYFTMIVNKSTIIIIIITMLTTMSRSIISILQPVSWPLASRSSQQVAREQRRPDSAFARTPSPTVVVVVLFLFLNFEYLFAQIPYPTVIVVAVFYL